MYGGATPTGGMEMDQELIKALEKNTELADAFQTKVEELSKDLGTIRIGMIVLLLIQVVMAVWVLLR